MLCKQPILEQERIVCLDTNVVLHQMDLVENLKFCNVVIFSTVLEEVQFAGAPYCTVLHRIACTSFVAAGRFSRDGELGCYRGNGGAGIL